MLRTVFLLAAAATLLGQEIAGRTESAGTPPTTYDLQINGETFQVEANRETTLESKTKPGVRYRVALRVAPTQQMRLDSILFNYDLPAKVAVDGKSGSRSVRITHELGFSVLLGDLGRPLTATEQDDALKVLIDSVTATLGEMKAQEINVTESHQRKFGGSAGRGVTIRYSDAKGFRHVYLLYVLSGPKHAATCVVEYLDHDADDALPLIKKMLDSVRAIPQGR
jgi:hypothetical protein